MTIASTYDASEAGCLDPDRAALSRKRFLAGDVAVFSTDITI